MKDFLTTTKTVAPPISILWYAVMIALVLLSIWSSLKYHDNPRFVKAFKWIQIAQLLMLYSWYFGFRIPFSNSLPFYHFPHITSFSFLIGHYALLVNSLIYLMNHYDKSLLKKYMIVAYTFGLNLFLVGVNQVTGGNYGLLKSPPFIPDAPLWIKYLLVSVILSLALVLFDILFKKRWKKQLSLVRS